MNSLKINILGVKVVKGNTKKLLFASFVCALSLGCAVPAYANKLIEAARKGDLIRVKQCLCVYDENIESKGYKGWTALMWAAGADDLEVVKYLVEHGADVNAKDNDGKTALMKASKNGYLEIVEYLVEHGADVNAKDNDGETALKLAKDKKKKRKSDGDSVEDDEKIITFLESNGASECVIS